MKLGRKTLSILEIEITSEPQPCLKYLRVNGCVNGGLLDVFSSIQSILILFRTQGSPGNAKQQRQGFTLSWEMLLSQSKSKFLFPESQKLQTEGRLCVLFLARKKRGPHSLKQQEKYPNDSRLALLSVSWLFTRQGEGGRCRPAAAPPRSVLVLFLPLRWPLVFTQQNFQQNLRFVFLRFIRVALSLFTTSLQLELSLPKR